MAGRPKRVADECVLEAAAQVLGRCGPHGLTLAAVGVGCGLSAAAVQRRFGSKRALLLALFELSLERTAAAFEAADAAADGPLSAVIEGLAGLSGGLGEPTAAAHHLAALADDLLDPPRRARMEDLQRRVEAEVAARLSAAMAEGSLPRRDPALLAARLLILQGGAVLRWIVLREPPRGCAEAVRSAVRWALVCEGAELACEGAELACEGAELACEGAEPG